MIIYQIEVVKYIQVNNKIVGEPFRMSFLTKKPSHVKEVLRKIKSLNYKHFNFSNPLKLYDEDDEWCYQFVAIDKKVVQNAKLNHFTISQTEQVILEEIFS